MNFKIPIKSDSWNTYVPDNLSLEINIDEDKNTSFLCDDLLFFVADFENITKFQKFLKTFKEQSSYVVATLEDESSDELNVMQFFNYENEITFKFRQTSCSNEGNETIFREVAVSKSLLTSVIDTICCFSE